MLSAAKNPHVAYSGFFAALSMTGWVLFVEINSQN